MSPMIARVGTLALSIHLLAAIAAAPALAQAPKARVTSTIEQASAKYSRIAREIWSLAEVGYQEYESSALLSGELASAGFAVEDSVAGIPTAFVASWGGGEPVIGILAEFDALPGITQTASPVRQPMEGMTAGHACGHHLFGTASTAAAVAVRDWLESSGRSGTIRVYGTPAEEGGAGKVYMVREGLFEDVDVVLHWHPGDENEANPGTSLANKSAKFRFQGNSAHAAAAPERGRSALDAVEAMNHMVNMMREHVPEDARIHYVITRGGSAPNVVPDFAEVYYYVRHPNAAGSQALFERVVAAAEGAALGTGTTMEYEIIHGIHSLLPNETLARAMHRNLQAAGGVHYDAEDREFAERIATTLGEMAPPIESAVEVQPFGWDEAGGSTDVGDVSWMVPTTGLSTATWVPGTAAHSWQAIAAGATDIGTKGMILAAKTLAMTAVDLYLDPELIARASAEFERRRGADFVYRPLLGDRAPPLDYRN